MADNDFPLINGEYHSWNEITMSLQAYGGGPIVRTGDFTAIEFKESLTPGDVKGQGGTKRGTTEGEYAAEGSITLALQAHMKFVRALAMVAKQMQIKLGAVQFSFNVSWKTRPGSPIVRAEMIGCRIVERSFSGSPSTEASVIETPLNVTRLRTDGLSLGEIPT